MPITCPRSRTAAIGIALRDGIPVTRPSHIGVYCEVDGNKCVLHAMEGAGMVVLHRIRDLDKYFLKVEGYYTWK